MLSLILSYLLSFGLYSCAILGSGIVIVGLPNSALASQKSAGIAPAMWAVQFAAMLLSGMISGLIFRRFAQPNTRKHALCYCIALLLMVTISSVIIGETDVLLIALAIHAGYIISLLAAVFYRTVSV
ncbi:MAG: hypothetical protein GX139_07260 [Armatimonadetes bacterium]|nr:hypothetical protein [Armatimonadota bacterium]